MTESRVYSDFNNWYSMWDSSTIDTLTEEQKIELQWKAIQIQSLYLCAHVI